MWFIGLSNYKYNYFRQSVEVLAVLAEFKKANQYKYQLLRCIQNLELKF